MFGALEFAFVFAVVTFFCIRSLPGRRHWSGREGDGAIVWGYHLRGGGAGAWRPLLSLAGRWHRAGGRRQHHWSLALRNLSFRSFPTLVSRVYCFSLLPGVKRKGCGAVLDLSV